MTDKEWLNLLFNILMTIEPDTTKELLELYNAKDQD